MLFDVGFITPVERHGNLWFKRDDLFTLDGMSGAKVRACLALCTRAKEQGYKTVVSAGSRYSPQLAILGTVAKHLGLNAVGMTAAGEVLPFIQQAMDLGVVINQVPYGYTNVIHKRAKDFAVETGAYLVPFGMKDELSLSLTEQSFLDSFACTGLFNSVSRIVVVAGSGVNLVGILRGLRGLVSTVRVRAVMVGHDCRKFVYMCCPWVTGNQLAFDECKEPYQSLSTYNQVNGVDVDSRYEGKAIPYLRSGDLFWLVGKAVTSLVVVSKEV